MRKLEQRARDLALVAANPEALARMLADWVASQWPERVRAAYWVTVSGDFDKGVEVTIAEKRVPWFRWLRASALVGRQTWGGGVFVDVAEREVAGRRVVASIGAGAARMYSGGEWRAVAALSLRL